MNCAMKVNELEKRLGISRDSIRFYEKEGLLSPKRSSNGYRNYTEEDEEILRKVILLRKLGISVEQIRNLLDGNCFLDEAMEERIHVIRSEMEALNGALKMAEQIRNDHVTMASMDAVKYLNAADEIQKQGGRFSDLVHDSISLSKYIFEEITDPLKKKRTWIITLILAAASCGIWLFAGKNREILSVTLSVMSLITLFMSFSYGFRHTGMNHSAGTGNLGYIDHRQKQKKDESWIDGEMLWSCVLLVILNLFVSLI